MRFHKDYGWTRAEVDRETIDYLMDIIVTEDKIENSPVIHYIDEVE